MWRETGFFRQSFVTVGDLAKNPVSEILGFVQLNCLVIYIFS